MKFQITFSLLIIFLFVGCQHNVENVAVDNNTENEIPQFQVLEAGCDQWSSLIVIAAENNFENKAVDIDYKGYGMTIAEKSFQNVSMQKGGRQFLRAYLPPVVVRYGDVCIDDNCVDFSCSFSSSSVSCLKKTENKSACNSDDKCIWENELCVEFSCNKLGLDACESSPECELYMYNESIQSCIMKGCEGLPQEECNLISKCEWLTEAKPDWYFELEEPVCNYIACSDYKSQKNCESAPIDCSWSVETSSCSWYSGIMPV